MMWVLFNEGRGLAGGKEGLEYTLFDETNEFIRATYKIADAMDCAEGTVMSRLFYARKKLQELLEDLS